MKKLKQKDITDFIVVVLIIIFLASLMTSLDAAEPEPEPMSFWYQCQIWNKWAHWPKHGQCPGDLQPRWYR